MANAQLWDELYAAGKAPPRPNQFLVESLAGCPPGRALDLGVGEGRNARWLAEHGWDVTGIDISGEALARVGPGVHTAQCSVEEFDLGLACWDLITALYVHGAVIRNAARIAAALQPGGQLIVEGFHRDAMAAGRLPFGGGRLGFATNSLLRAFASRLRVLEYQDLTAPADWDPRPMPVVRFRAVRGSA